MAFLLILPTLVPGQAHDEETSSGTANFEMCPLAGAGRWPLIASAVAVCPFEDDHRQRTLAPLVVLHADDRLA